MRIDADTGTIYLEPFGQILCNGMREDELKKTRFYQEHLDREWQTYERVVWYIFKPVCVLNQQLTISYIYVDHHLDSVNFQLPRQEGDPNGWDDWSEEKELEIMRRYAKYFSLLLNIPKPNKNKYWRWFEFNWGAVYSKYDLKSQLTMSGLYYKEIESTS